MSFLKKLFGKPDKKSAGVKQSPSIAKQQADVDNPEEGQNQGESIKIVPRVKADYAHPIYKSDQAKHFIGNPLPNELKLEEDQQPITKHLFEDLILCFAVDKGDRYEILQNEVLKKNPDLNMDILHQISVNAMIEEIGEQIKMQGDPNQLIMVTAGGNFEAAIILIDFFWEQIHQLLEGDAILAIPARDLLFIGKKGNQKAIDKLKEIINGFFDNPETQGLLSKAIYLKQSGKKELSILDLAF